LSLPRIFDTTLETVPKQTPYLYAKPELIDRWRQEFSYIDAFKIGINWQGNPRYRGDRHRSIPLEKFAPLAKIPGVRLISLQKGFGSEQIAKNSERFSVTELPPHRDEAAGAFMDTAAILMNLDLVISSDTSLVHLAGGLGVPIWVALPTAADWRWLLKREDCPWYPTMRLFRQRELGAWEELFGRISSDVSELVGKKRRSLMAPLSAGDLLDQIAALECELQHDGNGHEPTEQRRRLLELNRLYTNQIVETEEIRQLRTELKRVNQELRDNEADVHQCEQENDFGSRFAGLFKSIRRSTQRRAWLKQEIDQLVNLGIENDLLEHLARAREQANAGSRE
jgi:hypothetical protein